MPKPLSKLKDELVFNQDLAHVIDSMKGIAATQYFVMERRKTDLSAYNEAMEQIFGLYDFRRYNHPFIRARNKRKIICLVTTDSGFLGGLNMKVLQAGMGHMDKGSHFFVVGERGANYLKEYDAPQTTFPGIEADDSRFKLAEKFAKSVLKTFLEKGFGEIILVYPHALSFMTQKIHSLNMIPCPLFFKNKPAYAPKDSEQARHVILESRASGVIEYLSYIWLKKRMVEIFEFAKLAEYGARTIHLEESFSTLSKQEKQIKLEFFKARRAKIDQSIRESYTSQLVCEE